MGRLLSAARSSRHKIPTPMGMDSCAYRKVRTRSRFVGRRSLVAPFPMSNAFPDDPHSKCTLETVPATRTVALWLEKITELRCKPIG